MSADRFGPWSSSLDSGSRLQLSTFWKERMHALDSLAAGAPKRAAPAISLAALALLGALAIPLIEMVPPLPEIVPTEDRAVADDDSAAVAEQPRGGEVILASAVQSSPAAAPVPAVEGVSGPPAELRPAEPAPLDVVPVSEEKTAPGAAPTPSPAPAANDPAFAAASAARLTPQVRAIHRVMPSIVDIHTERLSREAGSGKVHGMGTGIIIDERGYIVTNQHVVDNATMLNVTLNDKSIYRADIISYDKKHDLAIVKIDARRALPVAPFGTSSGIMKGETVITIGNPFGYEHSTSVGIVSALGRNVEVSDTQSYQNLIQTDASINPGNSGGPLVNLDGNVVGINIAIRAGLHQRIGFALPIDDARVYIARLINVRQLEGSRHGLETRDDKTPARQQLVVENVEPGSPAAIAGFQPGDVVTLVGERPIIDRVDLERAFLGQPAGAPTAVQVKRNQETVKLTLQLDRVRDGEAAPSLETGRIRVVPSVSDGIATRIWNVLGLRLERVPPTVLTPFESHYKGGMKVVRVRSESPAAKHGIVEGDVLLGLRQWETKNLEDLKWILDQPKLGTPDEPLKFFIIRGTEVLAGELWHGAEK